MATTGHENESINVGGLKSSLQALKTKYVDDLDTRVDSLESAVGSGGSIDTRIENAIKDLDSTKSQTAGTDGLALSVTETDGKITSISGSIAINTYDSYGAASAAQTAAASDATSKVNTAKSDIIGGASSSGNTLKKLEDRLTPVEVAVGSGGSIDTRISGAVGAETARAQAVESALSSGKADKATTLAGYGITDAYTKSETYTKTEVNGLVDTPHQEYITVNTYSALPATGSKDTIYRVSNYNGSTSQVDASVYSEYAWNGSQYIFLCVKSQIGEVFDISVYNNNAKYADLTAALNGGTNIPQSLQKGGMSVKFVQSSDNKYVQYRLMANTFSTTVTDWQGVDKEPTVGSNNLVKSGGVASVCGYYTDNPEWLRVELDSKGNIISGTKPDGSHYVRNIYSETLDKIGEINDIVESFTIVDNPEYMEITVDAANHLLSYRSKDGILHEHKGSYDVDDGTCQSIEVVLENSGIDANGIDQYNYASFDVAKRSAFYIKLNGSGAISCSAPCKIFGYKANHNFIGSKDVVPLTTIDVSNYTYIRLVCTPDINSLIVSSLDGKYMTQEKRLQMNQDFDRLIFSVDENIYTAALLMLPPNYSTTGKKVPLMIHDNGDGAYKNWNTYAFGNGYEGIKTGLEYIRDQGFAVLEIYSWGSYYYNKYYGCGSRSAMPIHTHIMTHQKGVEYVCSRYNIDADNIFHISKSGSGKLALYYALVEPKFNLRSIYAMAPVFDDLNFGRWGMSDYRKALYEELNLVGTQEQVEQFRDGYEGDTKNGWLLTRGPYDGTITPEELEHLHEINQDFVRQNYAQFSKISVSWMNLVGQSPDEKFQDTLDWGYKFWVTDSPNWAEHESPDSQGNYPTYNRNTDIYNKHNLTMIGNHIPFKVIMAKDDEQTPYWSALEVVNQLRNGGKDATILPLETGGHSAPNFPLSGPNAVTDITTVLGIHYDAVAIGWYTAVEDIQKRFFHNV